MHFDSVRFGPISPLRRSGSQNDPVDRLQCLFYRPFDNPNLWSASTHRFWFVANFFPATSISIMGSFKAMPPLLSPVLYLAMTILTMPVITFSFLHTLSSSEASLAPQITQATTYSYPAYSSEKPRILDDIPSNLEMTQTNLPANYTTRNIPVYLLCGQISAVCHFAFAIGLLVLLPDQSSPPTTLTREEVTAGVWAEALVFRIAQTAFLVIWIICTMSAFLRTCSFSLPSPVKLMFMVT